MSIMPAFRIVNQWLGDPSAFPILRDVFAEDPGDLGDPMRRLVELAFENGQLSEEGRDQALEAIGGVSSVIQGFPGSHQAALVAVIRNALERDVPVQLAWQPAYDHEFNVTEFQDTESAVCGITVLMKSRHASDPRLGAGMG